MGDRSVICVAAGEALYVPRQTENSENDDRATDRLQRFRECGVVGTELYTVDEDAEADRHRDSHQIRRRRLVSNHDPRREVER